MYSLRKSGWDYLSFSCKILPQFRFKNAEPQTRYSHYVHVVW